MGDRPLTTDPEQQRADNIASDRQSGRTPPTESSSKPARDVSQEKQKARTEEADRKN